MNMIQKRWSELCQSPTQAIADWQQMRWWWLTSAAIALSMNLIAHYVFQVLMDMAPCEKCVYTRYAMFCIVFGGLIAAISPKSAILRLIGYGLTFYGALYGIIWSWELLESYGMVNHAATGGDPFAAGFSFKTCATEPVFHFGLPLDRWFPGWFNPTGVCGTDEWSFLGLNMANWTLIVFSTYLALVVLSVIFSFISYLRKK